MALAAFHIYLVRLRGLMESVQSRSAGVLAGSRRGQYVAPALRLLPIGCANYATSGVDASRTAGATRPERLEPPRKRIRLPKMTPPTAFSPSLYYVRNPQAVSRTSIMPKSNLEQADLAALADFMLALDFRRELRISSGGAEAQK